MAGTRRSKRSNASGAAETVPTIDVNANTDVDAGSTTPSITSKFSSFSASNALGMTPSQFSSLVCISIGMTHCLDLYRSVQDGESTTYCNRYFAYSPQINDSSADPLQCTLGDLGIMRLKYHTTIIRIILFFVMMMLCWGRDPLLKSWNFANAVSPLGTSIVGMFIQKELLLAPEKFSLGALLVMSITSNFNGRGVKTLMNLKEGLHNVALGLLTSFMSYTISNHLMLGAEGYTAYSVDGVDAVSEGGKALWFMLILVEYTAIMFASTFALFYLDEARKRVSTMAICILEIQFFLSCHATIMFLSRY
jgi:hypothetical protein